MKAEVLIEQIALPELRMLRAVDSRAAARKARRMAADTVGFVRGSLPLIMPWLTTKAPPGQDEPWVWSIGDAHLGNFATLATGRMDGDGIVPVTFGIADVDDEGPSPWHWDLLRLLSSVSVFSETLTREPFDELCRVTLGAYRECMGRFGEGDALAARIDANGLPEVVQALIRHGSAEAAHKRFIAGMVVGAGAVKGDAKRIHLRRDEAVTDDPLSAEALRAAWERRPDLPPHDVLDLARRLKPGGISSLGRRRWWLLIRERHPLPRLRLLEIKERGPGILGRAVPVSPFAPWMGGSGLAQPVVSTMGGDPYQRVLHAAAGTYLVRTRCHTRETLDLEHLDRLDDGDRRRLGHLLGQLVATFHWQGLTQLAPDAADRCTRIAAATAAWDDEIGRRAAKLGLHLIDLAAAFRKRMKSLLVARADSEALELPA